MQTTYSIGPRTFVLDQDKAEAAFAAKRVINGRETMFFNILPLQIPVGLRSLQDDEGQPLGARGHPDAEGHRAVARRDRPSPTSSAGSSRWASAISPPPKASSATTSIHVVRELVTAPELKLVLGRHAHEENIHADSLVYMISSLGINPHECEAMFEDIPTIKQKNEFVVSNSRAPAPRHRPHRHRPTSRLLAKNIFVFGQCMEGTQFYGLFGMVLALYRQNKFPGIGQMFRYTLRDESNHIEVFRNLFMDLVEENPDIWTAEFREELRDTMREAVAPREGIHPRLPARQRRRPHAPTNSSPTSTTSPTAASTACGLAPLNRPDRQSAALARRDDGHQEGDRTSSKAASPNTRKRRRLEGAATTNSRNRWLSLTADRPFHPRKPTFPPASNRIRRPAMIRTHHPRRRPRPQAHSSPPPRPEARLRLARRRCRLASRPPRDPASPAAPRSSTSTSPTSPTTIGNALTDLLLSRRRRGDIFTEENRGFVANVAHSVADKLAEQVARRPHRSSSPRTTSRCSSKRPLIENDAHDVAKSLVFNALRKRRPPRRSRGRARPCNVRLIRRNGNVVPGSKTRSRSPSARPSSPSSEDPEPAVAIARGRHRARAAIGDQAFVHIEDVQDIVQEELMRQGHYKVAETTSSTAPSARACSARSRRAAGRRRPAAGLAHRRPQGRRPERLLGRRRPQRAHRSSPRIGLDLSLDADRSNANSAAPSAPRSPRRTSTTPSSSTPRP